ncbi:MAG: phosphoserine phosphatase SerB [Bacteroidetes bacterium HLUCCA01]|nr:MAG: phosphoserine phosphatase SerB [Bacteroidetes bacterium HLUCCA01]
MREIILISVSGTDKPGLTNKLTKVLSEYKINILDVGQAVIHATLSLGILIEIPPESESSPVLRDILFKAHELELNVKFKPIDVQEYEDWVRAQGKPRYIITILGKQITALHMHEISEIISQNKLNIDSIKRLSGRKSLHNAHDNLRASVELTVRGEPDDIASMRSKFLDISRELGIDISFQIDNMYRRNRRMVAFDMDSTLIQAEVIDELAKAAGVGEQVAAITEQAMQGNIDFTESFRQRLALLAGLDEQVLASLADNLPITQGAENLISTLRKIGYKTAIISGGFEYFGKYLQRRLGIDYVFANQLEIKDGKVTGKVCGQVVNAERKAEILRELAKKEQISLDQVIAVGDGANDLPMLSIAGLGIAFNAKPVVKKSARHSISNLGLDGILYLIGVRDRDLLIQGDV